MKSWLFWAGVSFIIGGMISFAINLGATSHVSSSEDLSGYSMGWILVGTVLIVIEYIKKKNQTK
jgi:branched-subunit amino acid permease